MALLKSYKTFDVIEFVGSEFSTREEFREKIEIGQKRVENGHFLKIPLLFRNRVWTGVVENVRTCWKREYIQTSHKQTLLYYDNVLKQNVFYEIKCTVFVQEYNEIS